MSSTTLLFPKPPKKPAMPKQSGESFDLTYTPAWQRYDVDPTAPPAPSVRDLVEEVAQWRKRALDAEAVLQSPPTATVAKKRAPPKKKQKTKAAAKQKPSAAGRPKDANEAIQLALRMLKKEKQELKKQIAKKSRKKAAK